MPAPGRAATRRPLRAVAAPRLRVADVALFYGERSGGIRTYIDAKAAWAQTTGAVEHHVIVPGRRGRHREPPRAAVAAARRDQRLSRADRRRRAAGDAARACAPTSSLLHDPFWGPLRIQRTAHELGRGCRRRAPRLDRPRRRGAAGPRPHVAPGPARLDAPRLPRCRRGDLGRRPARGHAAARAAIDLRFGLHPAFVPAAGRRSAGTTSSTSGGSAARRASSSCCTRPRARMSRGRCGCTGAGRSSCACAASPRTSASARASSGGRTSPTSPSSRARTRPRAWSSCPARTRRSASSGFEAAASGARVVTCDDGAVRRAHRRARAHVRARRRRRPADGDRVRARREARPRRRGRAGRPLDLGRRVRGRDRADRAPAPPASLTTTATALRTAAEEVLRRNWREGIRGDGVPYAFTCPAPPRYRHMWHWDSCFHAIAWRLIDPARARAELRTRAAVGPSATASCRTRCSGTRPPAGAAPRSTPRAGPFGDRHTETIGPPLLALAWELVADASPDEPGFRTEAIAALAHAHALARASPRPRRGRPAVDRRPRRVRPGRLAEVRAGVRPPDARPRRLRAAHGARAPRALGLAARSSPATTTTSRTSG